MEEFRIGAGALRPLTVSHEGGARNVVNPRASRTRSRAFPRGRDRADRVVSCTVRRQRPVDLPREAETLAVRELGTIGPRGASIPTTRRPGDRTARPSFSTPTSPMTSRPRGSERLVAGNGRAVHDAPVPLFVEGRGAMHGRAVVPQDGVAHPPLVPVDEA